MKTKIDKGLAAIVAIATLFVFSISTSFAEVVIPSPTDSSSTLVGLLLNGISVELFLAAMVYAIFGMSANVVSDIIRSKTHNMENKRMDVVREWFAVNKWRLILTLILLPVAIIFCNQLFGLTITTQRAFFIGLSSDHLSEIISKYKTASGVLKGINTKNQEESTDAVQSREDNSSGKS